MTHQILYLHIHLQAQFSSAMSYS